MFPLLLLLDAAVQCRKQGNATVQGAGDIVITDAVAEAGLACLEVLLTKCRLTSVNQVRRLILCSRLAHLVDPLATNCQLAALLKPGLWRVTKHHLIRQLIFGQLSII